MIKEKRVCISRELSSKLSVLSFLSILFVLFNHSRLESQNGLDFEARYPNLLTVNTIVVGMTRLNRVLFFGIAGFLFGNGAPFNLLSLIEKFKNRFWTVLMPYLFSLGIISVGVLILIRILGPEFSGKSPTLSSIAASTANPLACLLQIRINAGFHLWFIESLILNVIGFGVFSLVTSWSLVAHFLLLMFSAIGFVSSGNIYLEGVFFFSLGTLMSRWSSIFEYRDLRLWVLVLKVFLWLPLLVLYNRESRSDHGVAFGILRILQSVLGASVVWQAVDFFPKGLNRLLLPFAAYTFPIYLIHAPFTIGAIRHAYIRLMPTSEWVYCIAWFLVAIATYLASYSFARLFERLAPKIASLAFGGRGAPRSKGG